MKDETTLLSCPFCGGKPVRFTWKQNLDEDSYYVTYGCTKKDHTVRVSGDSDLEAIEAWNTRYERTCHALPSGVGCYISCSECGSYNIPMYRDSGSHFLMPSYCPHCGAKVIYANERH